MKHLFNTIEKTPEFSYVTEWFYMAFRRGYSDVLHRLEMGTSIRLQTYMWTFWRMSAEFYLIFAM